MLVLDIPIKNIYIYDWVDNPSNSLRTFYNQVVAFNLDDRWPTFVIVPSIIGYLVGGWTNRPIVKIWLSNWITSLGIGVKNGQNNKYLSCRHLDTVDSLGTNRVSFHCHLHASEQHSFRTDNTLKLKRLQYNWFVVEPTHLKNMLVKMGIFSK